MPLTVRLVVSSRWGPCYGSDRCRSQPRSVIYWKRPNRRSARVRRRVPWFKPPKDLVWLTSHALSRQRLLESPFYSRPPTIRNALVLTYHLFCTYLHLHPPSPSPLSLDDPSTSPWSLSLVLRPIIFPSDLPTLRLDGHTLIPSALNQLASTANSCSRSFLQPVDVQPFLTRSITLLKICSFFSYHQ